MAEPFKQKQKSLERAESITGLAKEVLNKKKKPVKFTWKGFANLASGFLETNPFDKLKLDRIKELQEGAPEKEKDYIDFFEDLEKGLLYDEMADGGRAGYSVGGSAMMPAVAEAEEDQVENLSFTELRARLPQSIDNDIVQVIANSKQALLDFANIRDQQDVDQFNQRYNVSLNIAQEG